MFEQKVREILELTMRISIETDLNASMDYDGDSECVSARVFRDLETEGWLYYSPLIFKSHTTEEELDDIIDNLHLFVEVTENV